MAIGEVTEFVQHYRGTRPLPVELVMRIPLQSEPGTSPGSGR
jgi:hypothetical protein